MALVRAVGGGSGGLTEDDVKDIISEVFTDITPYKKENISVSSSKTISTTVPEGCTELTIYVSACSPYVSGTVYLPNGTGLSYNSSKKGTNLCTRVSVTPGASITIMNVDQYSGNGVNFVFTYGSLDLTNPLIAALRKLGLI